MASKTEVTRTSSRANPNTETGSIFFVGRATMIIRYAGFTILTDPNFLHHGGTYTFEVPRSRGR